MNTLLVVEGNLELRENVAELLELAGYNVITAANGEEGHKKASLFQPGLVICDSLVPQTGGELFFRLMKQLDRTKNIPIVFFSENPSRLPLLLNKGADGFLSKPFTYETLIETVQSFFPAYDDSGNMRKSA